MAMGASLLQAGEPVAARSCLEEGITLYHPHRRGEDLLLYGYDAKVASQAHLSWALAWLGLLDNAVASVREAMAWANTIEHPWSLAIARHFALRVLQWRGELDALKAEADANIALAGKYGFPFFGIGATILRGWADCADGEFERGIAQIRESMSNWVSIGAVIGQAYHFSLLADGYRRQAEVGDARKPLAAEGLKAVAAGLAMARKTGERCWDGELYRLKGELLLLSSDQNNTRAQASFRRAIDISRGQQATLFELRATASLAHYRSGRGTGQVH
jgi:predicted ATPase